MTVRDGLSKHRNETWLQRPTLVSLFVPNGLLVT